MEKEKVIRYIRGESSGEERSQVVKWIDADPENMREYMALHKLYDMTVWQADLSRKHTQRKDPVHRIITGRRVVYEVLKIAAVLIVAFLIFRNYYGGPTEIEPVQQTLRVPPGQRAEITLADGTNVWLNANTTFIFSTRFNSATREVSLTGEGYFDVAQDSLHPFVVKTGQHDVKVWGTEFNLLAYPDKNVFDLSLLEGKVELLRQGAAQGVMLEPGQRIFRGDNQLYSSTIEHMSYFLWKEGIISFDDEPFAEMVKKLELYFDLQIEVANDEIMKYRCTGKFRSKDGVEHILKVLQLSNDFSYTINEKRNFITIK